MILLEGLLRLLPGVVGKQESVEAESFSACYVDHPEYTAPVFWKDLEVPEVVRSGNHAEIAKWRKKQAVSRTVSGHFDWLRSCNLTVQEKKESYAAMPSHYVALMHEEIVVDYEGTVGTSSVTSIDIHDIARSSKSYGIKQVFIVTPLIDQQKIVRKLLDFWHTGAGIEYNASRHEAVKQVDLVAHLQDAIAHITEIEGKAPLIVATSARVVEHPGMITFYDQTRVWESERPVLFIFGTAKGLSPEVLARCDFLLVPVEGFTEYNHLSVRSAVAIVLDRWMGINIKKAVK
jgi:tRNA (guanine37-N1)-methyltransferase